MPLACLRENNGNVRLARKGVLLPPHDGTLLDEESTVRSWPQGDGGRSSYTKAASVKASDPRDLEVERFTFGSDESLIQERSSTSGGCQRCCVCAMLVLLALAVLAYVLERTYLPAQNFTAAVVPGVALPGVAASPESRYDCFPRSVSLLMQSAWVTVDSDKDDKISQVELTTAGQLKQLSPSVVNALRSGDKNGDQLVDRDEYEEALGRAGGLTAGELSNGPVFDLGAEVDDSPDGSWPFEKKAWCCKHRGVACTHGGSGGSTPIKPQPAPSGSADFDCADKANWQSAWSVEKKRWCCKNSAMNCAEMCSAQCLFEGRSATCNERVDWAANHAFLESPQACAEAHELVMSQCDVCAGCQPADTGCIHDVPTTTTLLTTSTWTPYNCNDGFVTWRVGWSPGKKDYCCRHFEKGCEEEVAPAASPLQGDFPVAAEDAPAKEEQPAEEEEEEEAEGELSVASGGQAEQAEQAEAAPRARDEEALAAFDEPTTTRAASTEPPAPEDPYNCKRGYFDWEESWSREKKDWCCNHRGRGCPEHTMGLPVIGGGR